MSGSGREAIPDVQELSGGPPGCLGVVVMPSRMSVSLQERSGGPAGCTGVSGRGR